jgi:hypothetical protein
VVRRARAAAGNLRVALETFVAATERLRERGVERVSILGVSKGAEAALLVSALSDCADAVIALAPTSVVWANIGPGRDGRQRPGRSSWTWQDQPLPFVPYDDSWTPVEPEHTPVSVLDWYERSLAACADRLPTAAIPVRFSNHSERAHCSSSRCCSAASRRCFSASAARSRSLRRWWYSAWVWVSVNAWSSGSGSRPRCCATRSRDHSERRALTDKGSIGSGTGAVA